MFDYSMLSTGVLPPASFLQRYTDPIDAVDAAVLQCWQDAYAAALPMHATCAAWTSSQQQQLQVSLLARWGEVASTLLELEQVNPVAQAIYLRRLPQASCSPDSVCAEFNGQGSKPPLVLWHPSLFDAFFYRGLAAMLGSEQPVIGMHNAIRHGALGLSELSYATCVDYYVQQLKIIKPSGPYHLGGWCLGGVLALGAARVLQQMGDEVLSLSLIDPFFFIHDKSLSYKQVSNALTAEHPDHANVIYAQSLPYSMQRRMWQSFLQQEKPLMQRFVFVDNDIPTLIVTSTDSVAAHEQSIAQHFSQVTYKHLETAHFCMLESAHLPLLHSYIAEHLQEYTDVR